MRIRERPADRVSLRRTFVADIRAVVFPALPGRIRSRLGAQSRREFPDRVRRRQPGEEHAHALSLADQARSGTGGHGRGTVSEAAIHSVQLGVTGTLNNRLVGHAEMLFDPEQRFGAGTNTES